METNENLLAKLSLNSSKVFIICIFLILSLIISLCSYFWITYPPSITNYRETFIPAYDKQGKLQIAIRAYTVGSIFKFLVVNPYTFETRIAEASEFASRNPHPPLTNPNGYFTISELEQTPYMKVLKKYTSPPYPIENYGIKSASSLVRGVFLTVDMCPSTKPFEEKFFNTLVNLQRKMKKAVPLAISLSGLWALQHSKEFDWLIEQHKKQRLNITWINHSLSHVYYTDVPFPENFLLTPQTNFSEEILSLERILLSKGQVPSVFFRFPGLVSDENLIIQLRRFGLIPIASDAWLAKEQQAKEGSIILVHGNSNEHKGIEMIMPQLVDPTSIQLLPLHKVFEE